MSPGTIDELEGLKDDRPNYIVSAYEEPKSKKWACLVADVSTGELRLGNVSSVADVVNLIKLFRPRELLCRRFVRPMLTKTLAGYLSSEHLLFGDLNEADLSSSSNDSDEKNLFLTRNENFQNVRGGSELVTAMLRHLKKAGLSTEQFSSLRPLFDPDAITLSDIAIRDLELFETNRTRQTKGSLFWKINKCLSPMGARKLRQTLANPWLKASIIRQRHQAIHWLLSFGTENLLWIRQALDSCPDMERLLTRVLSGNAKPQELARLSHGLVKISKLSGRLAELSANTHNTEIAETARAIDQTDSLRDLLLRAIKEDPGHLGQGCEVFQEGYNQDLDLKRSLAATGQLQVENYQERLRESTKIQSLKIKTHKTYGLLIEVTKANLNKVPETFIRRQTMVNCERFATQELKDLELALANAQEEAVTKEQLLYEELLSLVARHRTSLLEAAKQIANFDTIQSLSYLAMQENYCLPKLSERKVLSLKGARHPMVEHFVGKDVYVPNDLELSESKNQMLLTGPNMAGKSTLMRLTAISAILNQIGSYLPAASAELPVFDQIYTRVGASDDLTQGMSTFMVEMSEAATILHQATERSLVILDEVGRGTSTQDGLAIASAIVEQLSERNNCWTLFATHFHELVPFVQKFKNFKIMQTQVIEADSRVRFTHKLIPGASGNSFGIEVARLAGLPNSVLRRAKALLQRPSEAPSPARQQSNFTPGLQPKSKAPNDKMLRQLRKLNLEAMTPLKALNVLHDWQSEARKSYEEPAIGLFALDRQPKKNLLSKEEN